MRITRVRYHKRLGRPVRSHVRRIRRKRKSTKWGWDKGPVFTQEVTEEKETHT